MSPTERTLRELRKKYKRVGIVERFIHNNHVNRAGIRSDLFNVFDIVALSERKIIGVQSCGEDFSSHKTKMTKTHKSSCKHWIDCGGEILLIGWRKVKMKRGGKRMVYKPRKKWITREDLCN